MDVPTFFTAAADYGFTDNSSASLLRALQGAVDRIERIRPWPFLETSASLTFAGGSSTPSTAPPRLRAMLRARDMITGRRILPIRLDDLDDYVTTQTTQAGSPQVYYTKAGVLNFWPLPTANTVVNVTYIQFSPRLTETSAEAEFLLPARHHEVPFFGMLRRLYDQQDDPELAVTMGQQEQQLLMEMTEDLFKQQYDEPDFVRITDPNDF